jgi:3'(2'),5'-bisphosphate nucleotidase
MLGISLGLLDQVNTIARAAGSEIITVYARDFAVLEKEDNSPLTQADTAAHAFIIQHLKRLEPELPILSEEAVGDFCAAKNSGYYRLVDPLDGTKEFIKRNGEFTVNIALIRDGHAVLGVVYAPVLNVAYQFTLPNTWKEHLGVSSVVVRTREILWLHCCKNLVARIGFNGKLTEVLPGRGGERRCLSKTGTYFLVGHSRPMCSGTSRRKRNPIDGRANYLRRSLLHS